FARRTRSLKTFLRNLPQIIKEWYRNEVLLGLFGEYPDLLDQEGELVEVDYKLMPEPFLSIAFADNGLLLGFYQRQQEGKYKMKMKEVLDHQAADGMSTM